MCTNSRLIRNRYTGRPVRVSCGKCEACVQERAAMRTNRIRNHSKEGEICLFVTLTYSNDYLPYVRRSELGEFEFVNVYRDASVRRYRANVIVDKGTRVIDEVFIGEQPVYNLDVPSPRKMDKDKIGVICYPDIQDFFKRLRINLTRNYDYNKRITYWSCAELGPTTYRPHFHLLIWCEQGDESILRTAIIESWPFADKSRTENYIEIARNAASYVASYVNCGSRFPKLFKIGPFSPRHSYSKDFGVRSDCFSLRQILAKVRDRDLHYRSKQTIEGVPCITSHAIPEYVINRYFPKFKGYSSVTDDEIRKLLLYPARLSALVSERNPLLNWSKDDLYRYSTRLRHVADMFINVAGWSPDVFYAEYANYFVDTWNLHASAVLSDSFANVVTLTDYYNHYENINDLEFRLVHSDLADIIDLSKCQTDPNKRTDIVQKSSLLTDIFYRMDKSRKVVNLAMSEIGYDV